MSIETLSSRRGVEGCTHIAVDTKEEDEVEVAVGDAEAAAAEVEVPTTLSEMSGAEERRQAAKTGRQSGGATTALQLLGRRVAKGYGPGFPK